MKINPQIKEYIEKNIFPIYSTFDKGHDQNHINDVIDRSLKNYQFLDDPQIDVNMVYVIASYHDIGCKISRAGHPKHSADILKKDDQLKKWFTPEQIEIMAQACEDHSTSAGHEPRSIYGKIVSDADKDNDIDAGILRGWNFSLHHFPTYSFDEHVDDIHNEIVRRFGDEKIGGKNLVKFYISSNDNTQFVELMKMYAQDKDKFKKKLISLIKK